MLSQYVSRLPSPALAAPYTSACPLSLKGLPCARLGVEAVVVRTCISPNWAVPATELALKSARTYRARVEGTEIFTVLSSPGLKTYCAEDLSVAKLLPSSLPWSASVCLRVCQPSGSRSTT